MYFFATIFDLNIWQPKSVPNSALDSNPDRDSNDPTKCFTDLGKLSLLMVVLFKAQANYTIATTVSKNDAQFNSDQN